MSKRILFLPADPAQAALLLDLDGDGRVLSRTRLAPGTIAQAPASSIDAGVTLVVPGEGVRIERMELPAHSAAQGRAAAQALLSGRLARPAPLHVALDASRGPLRTVAAVEPGLLHSWLERAAAFGLVPEAAVPEQLLLPAPAADAPARVLDAGDRWLVRTGRLAFVAAPALAARVLGDAPRARVEAGLEELAAQALDPGIDLLQGDFTPASRRARPAGRRRLAWLAAALLASPLLLVAAQALRLELTARALESRTAAILQDALPAGATGDADALLRAAREPRALASAMGSLFAAVASRPGVHLSGLEYQRGDRLRAVLFHAQADDLDAIRAALAADGWRLVEGGSSGADGGQRTGFALEPEA